MSKSKNVLYLISYILLLLLLDTLWYWRVKQALDNASLNLVLRECLYVTGKLLMMVLPVWLYLKYIDSKEPLEYLKLKSQKMNGIKWGIAFGVGFIAYYLMIAFITKALNINFNIGIRYWIAGLLVGFVEEVPFRGFILQKLEEHFNFWAANLITVVIFLIYHYPTWYFSGHFKLFGFNIVFTGLIFGYLLKKSKSLWSAIITHSIIDLAMWIIF